jgi:hypothetical protein
MAAWTGGEPALRRDSAAERRRVARVQVEHARDSLRVAEAHLRVIDSDEGRRDTRLAGEAVEITARLLRDLGGK